MRRQNRADPGPSLLLKFRHISIKLTHLKQLWPWHRIDEEIRTSTLFAPPVPQSKPSMHSFASPESVSMQASSNSPFPRDTTRANKVFFSSRENLSGLRT